MGWWFRRSGKLVRRHMLLQQLEDRIVLDASVNPVQQDNQVSTDAGGGAAGDNAVNDVPVTTGDGAQGGAQASSNADALAQVYGQNLDEVLVANSPGEIQSVQATATDQGRDSGGLNVVLISNAVSDADIIRAAAASDAVVLTYDAQHDTLSTIEAKLRDLVLTADRHIDHLAILSHGGPGMLQLSQQDWFTAEDVLACSEQWRVLGDHLGEDARIDFYACNLAQGDIGLALVNALGQATGKTVWASNDMTGSGPDCNWTLEVRTAANDAPDLIDGNAAKTVSFLSTPTTYSGSFTGYEGQTIPVTYSGYHSYSSYHQAISAYFTGGSGSHGSGSSATVGYGNGSIAASGSFYPQADYYGTATFSTGLQVTSHDWYSSPAPGNWGSYYTETGNFVTITINILPVNDAPSGADKTITIGPGDYVISASDFGFTDPIDSQFGSGNNLDSVKITQLASAGSLKVNDVEVALNQVISKNDINAGMLTYTPLGVGSPYANFNFAVLDDGGTNNGGVNIDQSPNTIAFNVNDEAPVLRVNGGAGSLDPTFDADGKVTTGFAGDDVARSVAVQPDGKIVVAGYAWNGADYDFAVARYNTDGSPDTTFDNDGKVTTPIGNSGDYAYSVAVQPDGKIVVAGTAWNGTDYDFAVARYNSNGSPDTMFDGDGKDTAPMGTGKDCAYSVAVQTDGKIVVAGEAWNATMIQTDIAVARFNANGGLDTTFHGDGKVSADFGFSTSLEETSVALQPDGKIVVAGTVAIGSSYDFAVVRFNANGSPDNTFGEDGKVTTDFDSQNNYAYSVAIQPDGKIVVAGDIWNGSNLDFGVARYNGDGSPDTTFDSEGKLTTEIGSGDDHAYAVAVQPDGKTVVAGSAYLGSSSDFAVVRYDANGSPDNTFDGDGKVTSPIGSSWDYAYFVALQPDGKIVLAGAARNVSDWDIAVARYDASQSSYTENYGSMVIDGGVTITDPDNANMASATVQISGNYDTGHEALSIDSGDWVGEVSASWTSSTGTLNLTGLATTAEYESMLQHVKYTNWSDAPSTSPRTVTWRVSDGVLSSAPQSSTITVTAVNDTPTDIAGPVSVLENEPAGTVLEPYLCAIDADEEDTHTFSLVAGTGDTDNAMFTIDGIWLKTVASFDYEAKNSFSIRVSADDGHGGAFQKAFTINVIDANDSPTNIELSAVMVAENLQAGTEVGLFSTEDDDTADLHTYTLVSGPGSTDNASFTIESGPMGNILKTATSFDHEAKNSYSIRVRTTDSGLLSYEEVFTIIVVNVNEAPVISILSGGALDATFDFDGKVKTPIGPYNDYAYSLALQADGKIVVAGSFGNGSDADFGLVRYNSDGTLDTTFDFDGKVTTPISTSDDEAYSVAIQSDGKIVAAGYSQNDFALVRYNSDGSRDTAFGLDGMVTTNLPTDGGTIDHAHFVTIQPDGKILAVGHANTRFGLVRYNSDGSRDSTFGIDGMVTTVFAGEARSVAIQPDGKILVAGSSWVGFVINDFTLLRYNSDGSLDSTFDDDGRVTTNISNFDESRDRANSMAVQSDGKIVVAGYSVGSTQDFAVVRYHADGSLDTTFDSDGKVTTSIKYVDEANAVAIQPDGKIVVAGSCFGLGDDWDFALVRYNTDGSLDSVATAAFSMDDVADQAFSVAIQPDGKIVAAGCSWDIDAGSYDVAVLRYDASLLAYTEGEEPKVIDGDIALSDPDNTTLASATIRITGNYHDAKDILSIDSGDLLGEVTREWNATNGTLTLTGSATTADYESMLEHVTYTNTSNDPSTAVRAVTWMVNDGVDNSLPQISSISVSPVNDAPVNTVPESVTATVNTLTPVTGITIADSDAGSSVVQVTLGVAHGTLQVSGIIAGGLTAGQISGNGTSSVVLNGTLAQIDATLADASGLQYQSTLNYTGSDTLTVSSNDLGASGSGGPLTTVSSVPMTVNSWTLEYESTGWATDYWRHADGAGGYDVLFAYNSSAQQYYQHEGSSTSPYGNGASWRAIGDAGVVPAGALLDGSVHALKTDGTLTFQFDSTYHKVNYTSTLLGQFYQDFDHGIGDGLWYQKASSGTTDWAQAGETEQVWFQYSDDPNHWNLGNGFEYEYNPAWGVSYWRQADGLGGYDVLFAYAHSAGQWYQNEGTTSSPYGAQWYTLGAAGALGANYGLLDGNTHQLAAGLTYSYDGMQHRTSVTSTLLGQFYYDFDHATGDGLWYQEVGLGLSVWAAAGETEQVWFQYGADPNHWNLGNGFEYEYQPAWGVSYWRQADGLGGYDVLFAYAQGAEQWYQHEGTTSSPYGAQWYTLGAAGALGANYGLLDGNTHQLAAGLTYSYDGMQHRTSVTSTLLGQFYYDFDHATGDGLWYQQVGPGPTDWAQAGETAQVWFEYGATPYAPWDLGNGFAYEYNPAWGVSYWRHADGLGGYDVLYAYAHSAGQWYQNEGTTTSPYGAQWYTLEAAGALGANYGLLDGNTHQLASGLSYSYDGMQHRVNVTSTLLGQFYYDFDDSTGDGLWYQKIGPGPTDWAQAGETAQVWFQYGADPYHWDLANGFAYEYQPSWGVSYWRQADGLGGYDVLFAYAHSAGQWYQHEGTTSSPYGTQWYALGAAGALGDNYGLLDGNFHEVADGLTFGYNAMDHRAFWMSDLMGQFFYDFDHAMGDGLWYQYQPGSTSWLPANETEQVWFQYGADPNHWTVGSGFEYEYFTAYATSYWRQPIGGATYTVLYAYGAHTGQWYEQTTPTTNPYGDAWVTIPSRPTAIG